MLRCTRPVSFSIVTPPPGAPWRKKKKRGKRNSFSFSSLASPPQYAGGTFQVAGRAQAVMIYRASAYSTAFLLVI